MAGRDSRDFGRCPLCGADASPFAVVGSGRYGQCPQCRLVFQHPSELPGLEAERGFYETHENDPGDPGYRRFLRRLADPLVERVAPGARGLDFGSGPAPAMAAVLAESGLHVSSYDPIFAPDVMLLQRRWDFVTCAETVEHFHDPAREFGRLDGLLEPGGWLGVMTEPRDPNRDFAAWWYHRDPTHVCFFEPFTFQWLSDRYGWRMESPSRTVFLFSKREV